MDKIIVLDAGHGINTAGKRCLKSIDPNETREWVLNARIADKVQKALASYNCTVIRVDDTTGVRDIPLKERVKTANNAKATIYVSIHHDAGINGGKGGGTTVFYSGSNADRPRQAQAFYDAVIKETGLVGNRANKVVKKGFYVLAKTNCAALLIENGFMDSTTDTPIILTEEHAEKTARGIVNFLVAEYNLEKKVIENKKTVEEIAKEVIAGKWGNGTERKNALTKAGYNYAEVQKVVDALVKGTTKPVVSKKSVDEIAKEVINGKWGNGAERKKALTNAGYDYTEVQKRVDALLKGTTKPATSSYYNKYTGSSLQIDKVLEAIGVPEKYRGKWTKRLPVARANGIANYTGTITQNIKLINLAKQGKLKKA